jgi:uncharacterized membrane protein YfcA
MGLTDLETTARVQALLKIRSEVMMQKDGDEELRPSMGLGKGFLKLSIAVLSASLLIIFLLFDQPASLIANNFIIIPISFVAASLANATAVGGAFLFVPLFIYGYGITPLAALKLSLATQAFGMTSGAVGWSLKFIEKRTFIIGSAASLCGMWLGTYQLKVAVIDIKLLFGWVSIAIFLAVMFEIRFGSSAKHTRVDSISDYRIAGYVLATLGGGIITAWTAIGVGEIVALYLLFIYGVRIETAIGTGVAILAVSSIAGLFFHTSLGGIRWDFLAFTVPGVLLGGFAGARMGRHVEQSLFQLNSGQSESARLTSPLKWVFSIIILVDGTAILLHYYLYS